MRIAKLVLAAAAVVGGAAAAPAPAPADASADASVETTLSGYVHRYRPGHAIGGETDPAGWVLSPQRRNEEITLPRIAYLAQGRAAFRLRAYAGLHVTVRGVLTKDALSAGGVETPYRTFDLLRVRSLSLGWAGPEDGVARGARRSPLAQRLLRDLAGRDADPFAGAPSEPQGGLHADGTCDDGGAARRVALRIPPPNSADMYTDVAYVCRSTRTWWVHRTGGFMATDVWAGPFDLPRTPRRTSRR